MKLLPAIIIEVAGIILVAGGIGFEMATGADFGYMLISCGSVFIASGALIWAKFYKRH